MITTMDNCESGIFFNLVSIMFADYWVFINSNHILSTISFENQKQSLGQMTRFYAVNILSRIFFQTTVNKMIQQRCNFHIIGYGDR